MKNMEAIKMLADAEAIIAKKFGRIGDADILQIGKMIYQARCKLMLEYNFDVEVRLEQQGILIKNHEYKCISLTKGKLCKACELNNICNYRDILRKK